MPLPEQILCAFLYACCLGTSEERELEGGISHRQKPAPVYVFAVSRMSL